MSDTTFKVEEKKIRSSMFLKPSNKAKIKLAIYKIYSKKLVNWSEATYVNTIIEKYGDTLLEDMGVVSNEAEKKNP